MLTRLPKPKLRMASEKVSNDEGPSLHKHGIRLVFEIVSAVHFFTSKDKTSIIHIVDIHPMKDKEDERYLSQMFGVPFPASTLYYGGTNRMHHLRLNIDLAQVHLRHNYPKVNLAQPQDGWTWRPEDRSPAASTPQDSMQMMTAPSVRVVEASAESIFDPSGLPAEVKADLARQQMEHLGTKEKRLMSVKMWLHCLGIRQTVVGEALQEQLPCVQMMIQVTGQQAPKELQTAVPCGKGRWCNQCETSITMLGKCAHVPLMADILAGVLTACGKAWASGDTDMWKPGPGGERHECGPSCACA